jgi:parallel beta-helix repeat protein
MNKDAGLELASSLDCTLHGVKSALNKEGISIVGSNGCRINDCNVSANSQNGLALIQLSNAQVTRNMASINGQGIYIQSAKNVQIGGNNLSANIRYGLRMSISSGCNITDNTFVRNLISGINLVDCNGNYIYHNVFNFNVYQNAADNGDNHWDFGPKIGGNYWSDFKATGNPGDVPRQIPSHGMDRYPFRDPGAWR